MWEGITSDWSEIRTPSSVRSLTFPRSTGSQVRLRSLLNTPFEYPNWVDLFEISRKNPVEDFISLKFRQSEEDFWSNLTDKEILKHSPDGFQLRLQAWNKLDVGLHITKMDVDLSRKFSEPRFRKMRSRSEMVVGDGPEGHQDDLSLSDHTQTSNFKLESGFFDGAFKKFEKPSI